MNIFVVLVCILNVAKATEPFDWSKIIPVYIGVSPASLPRKFLGKPRIVGGQEAVPHEFPFQAALSFDERFFCGGSVISENYIITAAHCVDGAKSVQITLGAQNVQKSEATQNIYKTSDIKVHEDWDRFRIANDIALLRVASGMKLTNEIKIIRLPSWSQKEETFNNRRANVSGWGRTSDSSTGISPNLQYAESTIIENTECRKYYRIIKDSHICLDGSQGKGTCNGDSGGPMTITETDGIQTIVGVTSFGSGWGCEWGFPTAYARMTSYLQWISDNTEGTVQIRN